MPSAVNVPAALMVALAALAPATRAGQIVSREPPIYSAQSVVNAAGGAAGVLSPNCLATIYGKNLSWVTRALLPGDIRAQQLPTTLPGTGVRVMVGEHAAHLYFVSPVQINFLVPANLLPGLHRLYVALDGLAGPDIVVRLEDTSPGLFQSEEGLVVGVHAGGEVINKAHPAVPGETIMLFASGLGQTIPAQRSGLLPAGAAPLERPEDLEILLNDTPVGLKVIDYAGIAPGFAGLYQINLRLPDDCPEKPLLRIRIRGQTSSDGIRIPLTR